MESNAGDGQTQPNQQQITGDINRFRVVTKVRPFLDEEMTGGKKGKHQCTQFYSDGQTVALVRPNYDQRDFYFDCVLDTSSEQEQAYEQIAYPVVQDVLNGFNGVVMAYGQTGSGKTHTIFGSKSSLDHLYSQKQVAELHYESGIVPRCVSHIFDYIQQNPNKAQFRVTVSFLEIYMEQITDLLLQAGQGSTVQSTSHTRHQSASPIRQSAAGAVSSTSLGNQAAQGSNLKLREDPKTGIFVDGLTQVNVKSKEQLFQLIKIGAKRRSVNQTAMNKNSSRSHAVLQIFVEQRWVENSEGNKEESSGSPIGRRADPQAQFKKRHYKKALLTIVDLAGSERLSKTGSEGMRLQEAKNINKSIAALSNCISALAQEKPLIHVPFRDSKLTRLLTESLGGNSKTTICACISPSLIHYEESYSTLLFATRAMSVRTYVTMNEKIEYKPVEEQGRSLTPGSQAKFQQTPNEKVLLKQNSKLQEQTEELRQEVQNLKEFIKKQQSMVSSFTSMPYNPQANGGGTPNGTPGPHQQYHHQHANSGFQGALGNLQNYNSSNTHNTSIDGNQGGSNPVWGFKPSSGVSRNSDFNGAHHSQQIPRSQSPQPQSLSYNPIMMHQMSAKNNFMFGTAYINGGSSPQKSLIIPQQNGVAGGMVLHQITPQDSEHFQTLEGAGNVNSSYQQINQLKQSNQVYQQQQKDAQLTLKLTQIIDSLQEELAIKTLYIHQLQEENSKLKQHSNLSQGPSMIDAILSNPHLRSQLFDRLSKQK